MRSGCPKLSAKLTVRWAVVGPMRRRAVLLVLAIAVTGASTPAAAGSGDVDIREANVMGVAWESTGDRFRFDVTLYHDDDGEDGYADHWQVETLDGERLGRRTLAHPHGTRRFTRSADVTVPSGVETVVVRGHDQTHGYGGRAVLVSLGNGTARAVDQGREPRAFAVPDGAGDRSADGGSDATAERDETGDAARADDGDDVTGNAGARGTDPATEAGNAPGTDDGGGQGLPGPGITVTATAVLLTVMASLSATRWR